MPQFDFTTYPSQIFWFGLCFVILYLFSYLVILPRIKNILDKRYELISSEKDLAHELSKQINLINNEAELNFQTANSQYLNKIDEITKKTNSDRDLAIENLKKDIDEKVSASRIEIKHFIENSRASNGVVIQNLVNLIKNKITN